MKLRRALVTAAVTTALAPFAPLTAPAAFAEPASPGPGTTREASPSDATTPGATPDETPGETPAASATESAPEEPAPGETGSASPSVPAPGTPGTPGGASTSPSGGASPSASPTEDGEGRGAGDSCEADEESDPAVLVAFSGLPGKLVTGSGWHPFELAFVNKTSEPVHNLVAFAGVSGDAEGLRIFRTGQVALQAKNPGTGAWEPLAFDEESFDFLNQGEDLAPHKKLTFALRLDVTSKAPVGSAFTLGAGVYDGAEDPQCGRVSNGGYGFEIVAPGTTTAGARPARGGSVPLPGAAASPSPAASASPATGSLASTGGDGTLPVLGLVGGIAVLAGTGVVCAVRRRGGAAV
ncbi:hypothetical protein [Streptomyces sp. NRRL F-5630]|uniref:hypothetical protein n=1 Tax=Streptomyces sp. NRRL F-5630 TaxID=1463864 RepID=UPI003EB77E86